jgi:hypothetical protein
MVLGPSMNGITSRSYSSLRFPWVIGGFLPISSKARWSAAHASANPEAVLIRNFFFTVLSRATGTSKRLGYTEYLASLRHQLFSKSLMAFLFALICRCGKNWYSIICHTPSADVHSYSKNLASLRHQLFSKSLMTLLFALICRRGKN